MAKLAPLFMRLFFIFAFVYAWYLIASSPSGDSSVLISDENSDRQMQAILSKLEDDKFVPAGKNVHTIAPTSVDHHGVESRPPQKPLKKKVKIPPKIHLEEESDRLAQAIADRNKMVTDKLESNNSRKMIENVNVTESTTLVSLNADVDDQENIMAPYPVRPHDVHSMKSDSDLVNHRSESTSIATEERQPTDTSKARVEGTDNTSESTPDAMDMPAIVTNDGDGNIFQTIWNKIVDPLTDVDPQYEGGKGPCPSGDVLTTIGGGRLANCIWQYATVRSLSKFLPGNRQPYVQKYIMDTLSDVFENLTLPIVEDIPKTCKCCENTNWYKNNIHLYSFFPLRSVRKRFKNVPGNLILPKYSLLIEPVKANRENILRELIFKKDIKEAALQTIKKNTEAFYQNNEVGAGRVTYIGVHVRRTDYVGYLSKHYNLSEATAEYYTAAMDYFRHRRPDLGKPVFLVATDDVPWVEQNLMGKSDVFSVSYGGPESPGHDMAVLCHCNHSIIDYGTFGLWTAFYVGGETITIKTSNQIYQILWKEKNWHFVHLDGKKLDIW